MSHTAMPRSNEGEESTSSAGLRSLRRIKSEGDSLSNNSAPLRPRTSPPDVLSFQLDPAQIPLPRTPSPSLHRVSTSSTAPSHILESSASSVNIPFPFTQQRPSRFRRTLSWFGLGNGATKTRRLVAALSWNLSWYFAQVVVIIALLAIAATTTSPTMPPQTEWNACNRPLGAWASLWIGRCLLAGILQIWNYNGQMSRIRQNGESTSYATVELGGGPAGAAAPSSHPPSLGLPRATSPSRHELATTSDHQPPLPHAKAYSRLGTLSSLLTISWFVTAHILEYTSLYTCRLSSPHLWWLIFSILSVMYAMVIELLALGLIFLIVLPVAFVFWNLFLICVGRHPMLNPRVIRPEIDKLPKSIVEKIPLVMYIPFPSDAPEEEKLKTPEAVYSYPPKKATSRFKPKRHPFRFLRVKKKSSKGSSEAKDSPSELPFVRLEAHRAVCSICLCDFEEMPSEVITELQAALNPRIRSCPIPECPIIMPIEEDLIEEQRQEGLRLTDAGEGALPLRLLACGHVFHKTCLDPWLLDVSGRCPVCQRKVEVTNEKEGKSRRNPNRT